MRKQDQQEHWCQFCGLVSKRAVRLICYDSNPYENDKYAWACEEHIAYDAKRSD